MKLDDISNQIYIVAVNEAKLNDHEYITPEHFLYAALMFSVGKNTIISSGGNVEAVKNDLRRFFEIYVPKMKQESPIQSFTFVKMLEIAFEESKKAGREAISIDDIFVAFYALEDSQVASIINKNKIGAVIGIDIDDIDEYQVAKYPISGSEEEAESNIPDLDFLRPYAVNMTDKSDNDPVVIREEILNRTIQILCRKMKNNVLHVGESGVGKSAIIDGLVQLIQQGGIPQKLREANVFYLDIYNITAGTRYKGDFEERLAKILKEISKVYKPIVYIDEIHTVTGENLDATRVIRPYLLKGEIKFIGSTTPEKYKRYLEKQKAITKSFECIDIEEATIEESITILKGIKRKYESYHGVKYTDDIIRAICELSDKYIKNKLLPDKAIDVMDETGVYSRTNALDEGKVVVSLKEVEHTIANIIKSPKNSISSTEVEVLRSLKENMATQIFGQDEAIEKVVDVMKLSKSGLRDSKKPVASFLFVGPAGVGKAEIAKQLAKNLGIKLTRFDMSEYQEKHTASRFVGSQSRYSGSEEVGLLSEYISREPNSIIFLDNIEKAHANVLNVILQVMTTGTLINVLDKKVDFTKTILIMSSRVGTSHLDKKAISFDHINIDSFEISKEISKYFSTEFREKLDSIIVFNGISHEMSNLIAQKTINNLIKKLEDKNIKLTVTKSLMEYISYKGYSKNLGAREIVRTINLEIKPKLVEEILFGELSSGGEIIISFSKNKIVFRTNKIVH